MLCCFTANLGAPLEVPWRPLGGAQDLSSVLSYVGAFKIDEILLFVLEIIHAEGNLHVFLGTQRIPQVRKQLRLSVLDRKIEKRQRIGTQGPHEEKTARDRTPRPMTKDKAHGLTSRRSTSC